jgi:3-oxoadipate enol-lactonase
MSYRFPDYQVAGDGPTTVFLLHGAYGSKDYFRYEIETLARAGLRVVVWDAPGYGISPLPEGGLTIEGVAEAAGRLIDKEGTKTNVVLGHSMGGIIAPAVYAIRPDKVHGVVISATVASFSQKTEEDKKTFLAERIDPLNNGKSFRETAAPVLDSMFAPTSKGPMVDLVRNVALSTSKDTFCAAIHAIVNYEGVTNIQKVKAPTLLLAGQFDKVGRPESMERIKKQYIPHADYVCLADSAHYAFAEQHELFNEHLLRFIRERVLNAGH